MKYNIHTGLHKTATKFFQHQVFKHINDPKVLYNPEPLTQYMMDYIKAYDEDKEKVFHTFTQEKEKLERENQDSTVLISREILSGNLFSAYQDWNTTVEILNKLFPEANIFIFLRYQVDWLVSCYRESIHEHHYQEVHSFLDENKNDDFVNLSIKNLNYVSMLNKLLEHYNRTKVHIYFFENFKKDKQLIIDDMFTKMNLNRHVGFEPIGNNFIPNRGYSALSIRLSILKYKIFKTLNLKFLYHRPIRFFGFNSIPAGSESLSCLDKEKYWGNFLLRDNEEIRSVDYPNLTVFEKIKREFTWRYFIKNRLDKLVYIDWDILKKDRKKLDLYFKEENKELYKILNGDINDIPKIYI